MLFERYFLEEQTTTKESEVISREDEGVSKTVHNADDIILSKKSTSSDDGISTLNPIGGNYIGDDKMKRKTRSAMEILEKSFPRSTFSLFELFDGEKDRAKTANVISPPQPLLSPPASKRPPTGTPTLTGWNFNEDGTITGYIFGSPNIGDGYLVTTSPVVNDGERKQFETVTTATGSLYFLG